MGLAYGSQTQVNGVVNCTVKNSQIFFSCRYDSHENDKIIKSALYSWENHFLQLPKHSSMWKKGR